MEALADEVRQFIEDSLDDVTEVAVQPHPRAAVGFSLENTPVDVSWRRAGTVEHHRLVVRRDAGVSVTNTTRANEFHVLRALEGRRVPAPRALLLDEDGAWFGRPTILMERLGGGVDANLLTEAAIEARPVEERAKLAEQLCQLLVDIHAVDVDRAASSGVTSLTDPDTAAAAISRCRAIIDEQALEPQPELTEVGAWLDEHLAPSGRVTLVHGDFRPENVLVDGDTVAGVLDWELASIGDPYEDLGYHSCPLFAHQHFIPGAWESGDLFRRYGELSGTEVDPAAVHAWSVLSVYKIAGMLLTSNRAFIEGRQPQARTYFYQAGLVSLLLAMIGA